MSEMLEALIAAERAAHHPAHTIGVQIANEIIEAMISPNPTVYLWAPRLRERLGSIGERVITNAKAQGIIGTPADALLGDDAVVLHLTAERRLLLRQELYHAVHTLEAQARVAKAGSTRQRALTRRAADLRSVAEQLA
jgi:hypothetical protein